MAASYTCFPVAVLQAGVLPQKSPGAVNTSAEFPALLGREGGGELQVQVHSSGRQLASLGTYDTVVQQFKIIL